MPLPNTRVIHPDWAGHHRQTVAKAMNATCRITRADGPGTTAADGTWTTGTRLTIYEGPARIVRAATFSNDHPVQGERRLTVRKYTVQILIESPEILTGDSIEVLTSGDSDLTGESLRVDSILVGSEIWSRDLIAIRFEEGT